MPTLAGLARQPTYGQQSQCRCVGLVSKRQTLDLDMVIVVCLCRRQASSLASVVHACGRRRQQQVDGEGNGATMLSLAWS